MRVLLDACVLYPTVMREILLCCAGKGMFTPLWSARILEEWRRAVVRNHPDAASEVESEISAVKARFSHGLVEPGPVDGLSLPDENDRHVLAAALAGQAQHLVTLNLRDFPGRALSRHGIIARHPDSLLCELHDEASGQVAECVANVTEMYTRDTGQAMTARNLLKRARLPTLGKRLG